MREACAVCGEQRVYRTISPPHEWRRVLRSRRHCEDAAGFLRIPACWDCYFRVRNLVEAHAEMDQYDPETRERFERDVEQLLATLDLQRLLTVEAEEL